MRSFLRSVWARNSLILIFRLRILLRFILQGRIFSAFSLNHKTDLVESCAFRYAVWSTLSKIEIRAALSLLGQSLHRAMTDMPLKVSGPFRSFRALADDLIDATEKIDPADYPGWALRLWFHALGTVRSEVNDWLILELGYFTDHACDQSDVFNDEIETCICNTI